MDLNDMKEYKYKVELENLHEVRKLYSDAGRENVEIIDANRKKGIFKPVNGIRKKDLKITKKSAINYGEFIAYKIYESIGIPVCKVKLAKKKTILPRSKSGKSVDIPGCISYLDLQNGESFIEAIIILSWYKNNHHDEYVKLVDPRGIFEKDDYRLDHNNDKYNNNVEVIIPAFITYCKEKCKSSQEQLDEIKQNIINMVTADCKFANTDRNDMNYGLKIDTQGNVSFYPLFDNEQILGFQEFEEDIKKYSAAALQEHIDKELVSRMGITSNPSKIGYQSMMTYLFTAYPLETKKAYETVMKYSAEELLNLMNECEDLSEIHKDLALRIFRSRNRGFKYVKEEFIDENGNFIPQVLPSNKDMELISRRGYSSRSKSSKSNKSNKPQNENQR